MRVQRHKASAFCNWLLEESYDRYPRFQCSFMSPFWSVLCFRALAVLCARQGTRAGASSRTRSSDSTTTTRTTQPVAAGGAKKDRRLRFTETSKVPLRQQQTLEPSLVTQQMTTFQWMWPSCQVCRLLRRSELTARVRYSLRLALRSSQPIRSIFLHRSLEVCSNRTTDQTKPRQPAPMAQD